MQTIRSVSSKLARLISWPKKLFTVSPPPAADDTAPPLVRFPGQPVNQYFTPLFVTAWPANGSTPEGLLEVFAFVKVEMARLQRSMSSFGDGLGDVQVDVSNSTSQFALIMNTVG